MLSLFLTGTGLSAAAGLNAWLPLLILALADRATNVVNLPTPYNWLSSNVGLLVIALLLPLELIPDKIAKVDAISDFINTALRPGAAALAFMAVAHQDESIHLVSAMIFGLVIGGAVHWFKASARPAITANTRGLGNPIISLLEDFICGVLALVAVFAPYAVVPVLLLAFWYLNRCYGRMGRGETRLLAPFRPAMEAANTGDTGQS
ncbi:MAG: DUF4126 domain-containing protein [Thermomicrobiales bacterium]|nr:DUF4126 domain-containing protein [Thermomicrobiales bacterium]